MKAIHRALTLAAVVWVAPAALAAPPDKKACFKLAEDAQDLRAAGKLRDARAKLLECARDPCPAVVKNDCTKWVSEVDGEIPSIVVRASKGSADVPVTKVTIDGVEVAGYVDAKAITLDPGTRKIVVSASGESIEQSVIVVAGEKNRVITFKLTEPKVDTPKPLPPAPTPKPVEASAPVWPWIFAGVGVAGLAGFGALALSGSSDVRKLEDRNCEPRCPDGDVSSIKRKFLFADIALGVSVVSFAIATYGFVTTSKPTTTATVSLGPGFGFAGLTGSF